MSTFHKYRNQYNSNNHYQSNKRTYEHDYAGHQSKSFRGQNQGVYLDHKLRASCFKECTKWRISIKSGVNDCVATQVSIILMNLLLYRRLMERDFCCYIIQRRCTVSLK